MPEIRHTAMCDGTATVMFRPSQYIPRLQTLFNAFTQHVAVHAPYAVAPFRRRLEERFRDLLCGINTPSAASSLRNLFPESSDLETARLDYVGRLLGWVDGNPYDEHSVTRFAATQARLYPAYYQMRTLREVIGRVEAMPLLRTFIDAWMAATTTTDESLQDPSRFWDALEGEHHETSEVAVRLHRGRIAFRVNRCLWADAMRPLDDPEIAHAGTCYGDFPQIAAINPNFVLTRTMTLMQGDPYCDTCIHDRRHVDSIEHPSRALFDSLGADNS
ncbi:L-2-amino-thiazoline-4-carboxylic acid hydrolase [Candidatus Bipolaricaulota bacterium]|nr:L-2-amino-thiazoline-4-carboxylic acid hydrolase [Candidatus Bipolaricaulota bacterium]